MTSEELRIEVDEFIKGLMFEDQSTILSKTFTWLKNKVDISDFSINVNVPTGTVDLLVKYDDTSLAFTLFENA